MWDTQDQEPALSINVSCVTRKEAGGLGGADSVTPQMCGVFRPSVKATPVKPASSCTN